jgi:hypothetical protein
MVLEGVVLSIVAGAVALVLTSWTSKTFAWFFPANSNPAVLNGSMDHNVVIGIAVFSLLAGMLCGALPAWRSSHAPAIEVLKAESASISGGWTQPEIAQRVGSGANRAFPSSAVVLRATSANAAESRRRESRI